MEKSSEEATGGEEGARDEDRGHTWLRESNTPNHHSIGNIFIYTSYIKELMCYKSMAWCFCFLSLLLGKNGIREMG